MGWRAVLRQENGRIGFGRVVLVATGHVRERDETNRIYPICTQFLIVGLVPCESNGSLMVLLSIADFYWVLPSFYWVLLVFNGFYWALASFIGFYWVLLSFRHRFRYH